MEKKLFILLNFSAIIFMLLLINCNNIGRKQRKKHIRTYHLNGELKKEGYFINDTIPVDTIRNYSKDGYLESLDIYDHKGSLKKIFLYYKNGNVNEQRSYLNGKVNGICKDFYENGKIESITYFFDDIQVGDARFYFKDGGINLYNFFDFSGRNRIVREYDRSGKLITNIGNKLFIDSSYAINDTLVSLDTFKMAILISHPPLVRLSIYGEELDSSNNILNRIDINSKKPLVFLSLPISKGTHMVKIVCNQFDSANRKNRVKVSSTILK